MLEQIGTKVVYNNLSDELRKVLDGKATEAGRFIKYKFAIARKNPDIEQRTGGEYLYPQRWALSPVTFDIIDYDKKRKRIGLVTRLREYGNPDDGFRRVYLDEAWRGVYILDMNDKDDRDTFCYLELHPKLENGLFRDPNMPAVFSRIDEVKQAKKSLTDRENRANSMFVATTLTDSETRDFACAMGWDEHEDIAIIRDKVLEIADKEQEFFKNFINNKSIEYRAVIKRAMDNNIIAFQPVENKFVWVASGQAIAVLERCEGNKVLDRMSDWVQTSKNGQEVYSKLKGMLQTA
jgi:hypothetical protein